MTFCIAGVSKAARRICEAAVQAVLPPSASRVTISLCSASASYSKRTKRPSSRPDAYDYGA